MLAIATTNYRHSRLRGDDDIEGVGVTRPVVPAHDKASAADFLECLGHFEPLGLESGELPGEIALPGDGVAKRMLAFFAVSIGLGEPGMDRLPLRADRLHLLLD